MINALFKLPFEIWVGFAAFSIYGTWALLSPSWERRRTQSWPTTAGHITTATMHAEIGVAVNTWQVRLIYTYGAAEARYRGEYSVSCITSALAEKAATALRHAELVVHYNPHQPSQSRVWDSEISQLY